MNPTGKSRSKKLALAALGVVYGDIGTSPLYAMKEVFAGTHHAVPISLGNVLGILSIVFWALMLVVSGKYVSFVMRADNHQEGGIMALMALALRGAKSVRRRRFIAVIGLCGAALFCGDAVVTPAISVLSAVEGLELITPAFSPYVLPIALGILIALFCIQHLGTASVGKIFGPLMLLWFAVLALLGVINMLAEPSVLRALNPYWAFVFLSEHPTMGFFSLGAVVLCLTGAEALYADMGHFGRKPIQAVWFSCVFPALVINYFGQGALLLSNPNAIHNPFYSLAPSWALYPLVILATLATVIASQAVISGVFSMIRQAIQLGYAPRFEVRHTSEHEIGQVYLPAINWLLLSAIILLVLSFGSSSRLAAAYGIAVTGTMLITSLLAFIVARQRWRWKLLPALLCVLPFVLIDLAFFSANALKIFAGGWFPVVFGALVFMVFSTWKLGREQLTQKLEHDALSLADLISNTKQSSTPRVPGTAVFLTSHPRSVPRALLHSLKHYKVLHERMIILTVRFASVPYVPSEQRVKVSALGQNFWQVTLQYGFKDIPDIPAALLLCAPNGLSIEMMETSFFLSREILLLGHSKKIPYWRAVLFVAMFKNVSSLSELLKIPPNRLVEMGVQVSLA